jgi:hypothetical protein
MGDVLVEKLDHAGIRRQFSGNKIKQRRLAGSVGTDDEASLARFDVQIDVGGHVQSAERFAEA